MAHRIDQAAQMLRNLHPELAQVSTLKSISVLLKEFTEHHGFPCTDTPEGRALDAIDDMLMALDESGAWPAAANVAPTIQTTAWGQ